MKEEEEKCLCQCFAAAKLAAAQGISTRGGPEVHQMPMSLDTGKTKAATQAVQVMNGEPVPVKEAPVLTEEDEKIKKIQEEVRKKKEEEEKKEIKNQDKSRPISSTPVPGTPW